MFKILAIALLFISGTCSAQFFQKSPLPGTPTAHVFNLDGATAAPSVQNFLKPLIGISASVSTGAALDGGVGFSFQHSKSDPATNSWVIQYSISALGFLGTNGKQITGTGGLVFGIPGTGGLIQIGPGWDFTNKQIVLLTGVGIPIF